MTYNESTKISIYKWRENHKKQHNEYLLKKNREYILVKRDHINSLRRRGYIYQKQCKIFRNILIDDITTN